LVEVINKLGGRSKMNIKHILVILTLTQSGIVFALPPSDQENKLTISSLWEDLKTESAMLLEKSIQFTSRVAAEMNDALDAELIALRESQVKSSDVDVRDKIDTIRIYVENISDLKKHEGNASSFSLISKSKKDYRIEIDQVLKEIEPILFDGEIVDYASKIRNAKKQTQQLKQQKVSLNEDLVFASEEGSLLKSSKGDIRQKIAQVDRLIRKSEVLIDEHEFDLKKKMDALGIKLSRAQINVLTTRVDGDELARAFAIFDITKQISNTLGKLVQENSFSADTTVKYYGTYVILSEILGYSQREYISKIEDIYLPAISKIEDSIEDSINFAENALDDANSESNRAILKGNIRSNEFSLDVVESYREILKNQINNLEVALERTNEQITVAYSTYDTAANSANLVNLISETQDSFNRIMNLQVPDIIPFENTELELKFQEISDQILNNAKS
jgi:hypothetical protein